MFNTIISTRNYRSDPAELQANNESWRNVAETIAYLATVHGEKMSNIGEAGTDAI